MPYHFLLPALAVVLLCPAAASAHDFSYETLLLGWMKLKGDDFDYKANAEAYLRLYRPDTWNRVKDNEIQLGREKVKTIEIMKARVKGFALDEKITLDTRMTFGQYDAEEKAFPLNGMAKTNYWYPRSPYPTGTLPNTMKVFFSNPQLLQSIPMSEADADRFLDGRNRNGYTNRTVNVRFEFKLLKAREGSGELVAEIQSAAVYDDQGRTRLLHKVSRKAKGRAKQVEQD